MAILKCKMCGGTIEYVHGSTVGECQHCGTKQTLPNTSDEVVTNLFNRANNLRLKCDFDKAMTAYEKIVEQDDSQAEAHWGIVLCKYGIEYVDDPASNTKIPTCHRTLYNPITKDVDYQAAIDYADTLQQSIYEKEARNIDKIQKNILAIVQNEEPFDVFICYKETDEYGKRTKDSVLANDIYYQLTQEGFKVFYAAITLEDKLGQEYEPYIFAALSTAKVMLVVGSEPEYFNAVWVKNEWSRFLNLMKSDRSKILIPCYKDMDAYDLPEEFSHLQAQNMGKIGFITDVIRGISKIIKKKENNNISNSSLTNVSPLLERAYMFLEDEKWDDASVYCEKVLDTEPKNAKAYLGKMLAELKIRNIKYLEFYDKPLRENYYYKKVKLFGDDNLIKEVDGYFERIDENCEKKKLIIKLISTLSKYSRIRNEQEHLLKESMLEYESTILKYEELLRNTENAQEVENTKEMFNTILENTFFEHYQESLFSHLYDYAIEIYNPTDEQIVKKAACILRLLDNYKNSKNLSSEYLRLATDLHNGELYEKAIMIKNSARSKEDFLEAAEVFKSINESHQYDNYVTFCLDNAEQIRCQNIYNKACYCDKSSEKKCIDAIKLFTSIIDYKDSKEKINLLEKRIQELKRINIRKKMILITTICIYFFAVILSLLQIKSKDSSVCLALLGALYLLIIPSGFFLTRNKHAVFLTCTILTIITGIVMIVVSVKILLGI